MQILRLTYVYLRAILSLKLTETNRGEKMTLKELPVGKSGIITAVGGEGILRCRLLDMGLIPNTKVTVQKIAPMGDPMEIRLRGYELTLRLEDAARIEVLPEVSG